MVFALFGVRAELSCASVHTNRLIKQVRTEYSCERVQLCQAHGIIVVQQLSALHEDTTAPVRRRDYQCLHGPAHGREQRVDCSRHLAWQTLRTTWPSRPHVVSGAFEVCLSIGAHGCAFFMIGLDCTSVFPYSVQKRSCCVFEATEQASGCRAISFWHAAS